MSNKWTKEDIEIAVSMIEKYSTFEEIATTLSRTNKSVKLKLAKLGYLRSQFSTTAINCLDCQSSFTAYVNENRRFCSRSCSAKFNNKIHIKRPRKGNIQCLECKSSLINKTGKKYCSLQCQQEFQFKQMVSTGTYSPRVAKRLLMSQSTQCSSCNLAEWQGQPIPLELDHVNGDSNNNTISNLRLLCPNCHAQTSTYKGRNKGNGRHTRMKRYHEGKSY